MGILFLQYKSFLQVATLPYVHIGGHLHIMLISRRNRENWIIPKGWPAKNLSFTQAAQREAMEEAGIEGLVQSTSIGEFSYQKRVRKSYFAPCRVIVYPLLVTKHALNWEEKRQRRILWCPLVKALTTVTESGLTKLLKKVSSYPERLHVSRD